MKKIVSFDFDGTMCFTPGPEEGKKIWEQKTGMVFPYPGWWSKKETLDQNIFHIPVNPFVYKKYLEAVAEDDTMVILATGRLAKLQKEVEKVLISNFPVNTECIYIGKISNKSTNGENLLKFGHTNNLSVRITEQIKNSKSF